MSYDQHDEDQQFAYRKMQAQEKAMTAERFDGYMEEHELCDNPEPEDQHSTCVDCRQYHGGMEDGYCYPHGEALVHQTKASSCPCAFFQSLPVHQYMDEQTGFAKNDPDHEAECDELASYATGPLCIECMAAKDGTCAEHAHILRNRS